MPILNEAYKLGWIATLGYLATYRPHLEKHNLIDAYQGEQYPKFHGTCSEERLNYRTLDGTCNDLDNPMAGSINMFFGRNMPGKIVDDNTILDPHPRIVSQRLLKRQGDAIEAKGLNLLVTSWIQFQTHDWMFHDMKGQPRVVPVPKDDPMYATTQQMLIPRTVAGRAQAAGTGQRRAAAYPNLSTAWWDLSQIYGTDVETNKKMRTGVDGKLKFNEETGWLPFDAANGQEYAGFTENWWTGLAMWHNLWTKEHNYLCDLIKRAYPKKTDQELHDLARLAITNVNAKVHTIEWTEAVLNNKALHVGMHANWYGLSGKKRVQDVLRHIPIIKDSGVLAGLVQNKQQNSGVPFAFTEEFASVYRMHSLLPDFVQFRTFKNPNKVTKTNIKDTAFGKNRQIIQQYQPIDLYYSFGRQAPTALTLKNFPEFLMNLVKPSGHEANVLIDVSVRDIIRERERGVPRYNEFRRQLNLEPIKTFDELVTKDPQLAKEISDVYGGDVEKVDLLIGCLAEDDRPENFGFGETAFAIFIVMASRRLKTDRFLSKKYFTPEHYTQPGYDYAVNTGMKDILERQFPQLKGKIPDNPFFEWKP